MIRMNGIGIDICQRIEFYEDGDEVISIWKPQPQFQGWIDTLHGGIQAVLLDEICAWVFVPRKTTQTPAIVVELKWNQTAEAAITQIKRKQYVESLKDYRGEVILVGINYESKELKKDDYKKHSCKIERITMA